MSCSNNIEALAWSHSRGSRSHSAQGLAAVENSPAMKIPLPPRMWITDIEDESSDGTDISDEMVMVERSRVRSRFRHHKQRSLPNMPIGIFWDIENCQVPRGCSAIDVVSAIRAKFLGGRREADFVVVCDVRKEAVNRLQELNDAQVSLIHVCGTQKNAADEKLRQCMRRFGELHAAPAALLLISGDINFAGDLSDFRHRKNMEVILVHKQNTSSALIACASSHYSYNDLTANLPRNPKKISHTDHDEVPTCEMEILNLPVDQPPERVSRRLRRLADNCGGKVLRVTASTAMLRFPTPDHASRALKRMDGEDVFGRKIGTRYARSVLQPTYSSDEGYSTAPAQATPRAATGAPIHQVSVSSSESAPACSAPSTLSGVLGAVGEWALALQQLPEPTPPPHQFCPPPAPRPRKIRGTHGSASLDRSGCSSSNSGDDSRREHSLSRAVSPWNCSASLSEHSETDECAELTVTNLPPYELPVLQEMLTQLFNKYVPVVRAAAWTGTDGPLGVITLRSEWDARLAIARIHKRRLENHWNGRRLELTMGRPTPTANLDVLRVRLRALLLEQPSHHLPLLRLRDAYASRHCCALTTADLAKIRDTVYVHEGFGRLVQLVDLRPVSGTEAEEGPWQCRVHAGLSAVHEDGSRVLRPVYMEAAVLARHTQALLESHGGVLPLLSFVECYEAQFAPLMADPERGVPLELLLRNAPTFELRDNPSRHLAWRVRPLSPPAPVRSNNSDSSRASDRGPRTAPVLEPMLLLFERELVDLLRSATRCCIPFSKLIPAFHHHFGRQCRVADYGFTKLPDLLAALSNTIVVLGSGSSRVITLSAVAQARRWTTDLVKLLKAQPGRVASLQDIPPLYQLTFGKPFSTVDYGVCTLPELMQRVLPEAVVVADGTVSLPRPSPTPEEKARILQFSMQAVELLCHTPTLSMEFSRFVPAYHAHFGRQLRVGHYGCVKLADLLEAVPGAVLVAGTCNGERVIRLARRMALTVIGQRLRALAPVFLSELPALYAAQFGAAPQPEALGLASLAALVFACGGCVERGVVRAPGDAPHWATAALTACSVLAADRSVARGSTQEYFVSAFRRIRGCEPEISNLEAAGVIEVCDRRVQLSGAWRAVWRVATLLCEGPRTAGEVLLEYTRRYEPSFCADVGVDGMCDFLRSYSSVFLEVGGETGALWTLCSGVTVAHCLEYPPLEDYSVHDTPPGQKGSRVFESPKTSLWCSPPASALPAPTALLPHENKREFRFYVFSAYVERRTVAAVRVIAATKTRGADPVFCRLWLADNRTLTLKARVQSIRENWNLKYSAAYVLCLLRDTGVKPQDTAGASIAVLASAAPSRPPTNLLTVLDTEPKSGIEETVHICVKPFHFTYGRDDWMIEWLELHRLLGVSHFYMYNSSLSAATACLLSQYRRQGLVTLLPWKLPIISKIEIRTEGQFAAFNDCLYRSMSSAGWLLVIDVDEAVLPRRERTLPAMFSALTATYTSPAKIPAAFLFRNAFFYVRWEDDPNAPAPLLTARKTRRWTTPHGLKNRSKYAVRPREAVELGNHFLWEHAPGATSVGVRTDRALLHHYRVNCEYGGVQCLTVPSTVDRTAHRWSEELMQHVTAQKELLSKACPV